MQNLDHDLFRKYKLMNSECHATAPLSRDQFARALAQGRGSAKLHVMKHGLSGLEDLVLKACLENQAYDRQCEEHRALWLYEMFKNTPASARFSKAIIGNMLDDDGDCFSQQVCELAALMALDGDEAAATALRTLAWSQPETTDGIEGGRAIFLLDGIPAIVEIARRTGRFFLENPDEYADGFYYLTKGSPLADEAFAELKRLAKDDIAIAAFVARQPEATEADEETEIRTSEQQAEHWANYCAETLRECPVEKVIAAAKAPYVERRFFFTRFGKCAREEDLRTVLDHFNTETDVKACRRLLWVFAERAMPELDARIWSLANDSTSEHRAAATGAMASTTDPRVGQLGRERLRSRDFVAADEEVIALLTRNYEPGDETLILDALESVSFDDDEAHAMGMRVDRVCGKHSTPYLASLAEWNYRTNPCTLCRLNAVECLVDTNSLPDHIANECMHDAESLTRALVQTAQSD